MNTPEQFVQYLSKHDIPWDDSKAQLFERYFEELVAVNQHLNLTRITDQDEVYTKHFLDSLSILSLGLDLENKTLCDIGSGGGFPGIPLAIMKPTLTVTSIESTGKKVDFQKNLIEVLDLKNVYPVHQRVEDVTNELKFDYVISRAVARLSILVELSYRLIHVGGFMIFLKGPKLQDELKGANPIFHRFGLISDIQPIHIDEVERNIIVIEKKKDVPMKSRTYGSIKNHPLW